MTIMTRSKLLQNINEDIQKTILLWWSLSKVANSHTELNLTTHTLSPLTMYSPSMTCSTPSELLYTRSWLSSRIRLMVWSKPFSWPWKTALLWIYLSFYYLINFILFNIQNDMFFGKFSWNDDLKLKWKQLHLK